MKLSLDTSIAGLLFAGVLTVGAWAQSPVARTDSAGAASGSSTGALNSNTASKTTTNVGAQDGIAFQGGAAYLIHNGRATRIDATLVPTGQMMTSDGRLMPLPVNVAGFTTGSTASGEGLSTEVTDGTAGRGANNAGTSSNPGNRVPGAPVPANPSNADNVPSNANTSPSNADVNPDNRRTNNNSNAAAPSGPRNSSGSGASGGAGSSRTTRGAGGSSGPRN